MGHVHEDSEPGAVFYPSQEPTQAAQAIVKKVCPHLVIQTSVWVGPCCP